MFDVIKYYILCLQPTELEEPRLLKIQLKDKIICNQSAEILDITASCILWKAYMQGILCDFIRTDDLAHYDNIYLDLENYRPYYANQMLDIQVFDDGQQCVAELQKKQKQTNKQTCIQWLAEQKSCLHILLV